MANEPPWLDAPPVKVDSLLVALLPDTLLVLVAVTATPLTVEV
jgi:hypothetical protein